MNPKDRSRREARQLLNSLEYGELRKKSLVQAVKCCIGEPAELTRLPLLNNLKSKTLRHRPS